MKTYKQTIESNRLVIEYDDNAESPREWSNLGYFITVDSNYISPDNIQWLYDIVKETGEEAGSQEEHIEFIKKRINEISDEKVVAIYPITKYEHSGISYSLGNRFGFDYSNNGFYIITDKTAKEIGVKKKNFEKITSQEIEAYTQWLNGEIYRFTLYDDNGEVEDD